MNGDEEFFDAVTGERTENWAILLSDVALVRDTRTAQEAHAGARRGMFPDLAPNLGTELSFGP